MYNKLYYMYYKFCLFAKKTKSTLMKKYFIMLCKQFEITRIYASRNIWIQLYRDLNKEEIKVLDKL